MIEVTGDTGEGVRIYSERRAALVKTLPVRALEPGEYELQVLIQDRIREESLSLNQNLGWSMRLDPMIHYGGEN